MLEDRKADFYDADAIVDQLRNTDLNLLTSFYVLMKELSVTKAAGRMLISQPAMSRAYHRLQSMFEDELLVRTGKRYEPTEKAVVILAELQPMLPHLGEILCKRKLLFDPMKFSGWFRIALSDFSASVYIPGLISILTKYAPAIKVDIVQRQDGFVQLKSNEVDLVMSPEDGSSVGQGLFNSQLLIREKLVCLLKADHPLARGPLTARRYVTAKHIMSPQVEREARRKGLKVDVRARIPFYGAIGRIIANTDIIATLPLQVARRLKSPKMRIVSAPREFGHVSNFYQVWRSQDSNAFHKWLRALIKSMSYRMIRDLDSVSYQAENDKLIGISELSARRLRELAHEASL